MQRLDLNNLFCNALHDALIQARERDLFVKYGIFSAELHLLHQELPTPICPNHWMKTTKRTRQRPEGFDTIAKRPDIRQACCCCCRLVAVTVDVVDWLLLLLRIGCCCCCGLFDVAVAYWLLLL